MYHDAMMSRQTRPLAIAALFAVLSLAGVDRPTDASSLPSPQEDLVVNVGDRVFFDIESEILDDAALAQIEKWAFWMQEYPELIFSIEGHTDVVGSYKYNCELGLRQAFEVRDELIALGIDEARLYPATYGEYRPAVLGDGEPVWSQNRRVTLVVLGTQPLEANPYRWSRCRRYIPELPEN